MAHSSNLGVDREPGPMVDVLVDLSRRCCIPTSFGSIDAWRLGCKGFRFQVPQYNTPTQHKR